MRAEAWAIVVMVVLVGSAWSPPPRSLRVALAGEAPPRPARRLAVPGRARRAQRRRTEHLPLVLDLLARELRSGVTLTTAVAQVAPGDRTGLGSAIARIEQGEPVIDAIDRWLDGFPPADAAFVGGVFRLGLHTGAAIARALDRAAAALRAQQELTDEVRALTAQSRASALVVGGAPAGFLAFVAATDAGAASFLFTEPVGWACVTAGLALEAVGFWWMRWLVQRFDR